MYSRTDRTITRILINRENKRGLTFLPNDFLKMSCWSVMIPLKDKNIQYVDHIFLHTLSKLLDFYDISNDRWLSNKHSTIWVGTDVESVTRNVIQSSSQRLMWLVCNAIRGWQATMKHDLLVVSCSGVGYTAWQRANHRPRPRRHLRGCCFRVCKVRACNSAGILWISARGFCCCVARHLWGGPQKFTYPNSRLCDPVVMHWYTTSLLACLNCR